MLVPISQQTTTCRADRQVWSQNMSRGKNGDPTAIPLFRGLKTSAAAPAPPSISVYMSLAELLLLILQFDLHQLNWVFVESENKLNHQLLCTLLA